MFSGFWGKLEKPIIGLAPMDGVTDAAFRYMVCKHSKPAVVMTEFTNVEGLARGAAQMLVAFLYSEIERPCVAQIYGVEVDSYYKCAVMLCALGFDGIDINMGCPANKVAKRGSGAALIKTPELAKELIRTCKRASKDWSEGITMKEAGVHENCILEVEKMNAGREISRCELPISVKTRIGFDQVVAEEWIKHLLEEAPACITMHGRTLKQMYLGEADWDSLAKAAKLAQEAGTIFLGNGDVKSLDDAKSKIAQYGVDGALAGRATFGNPWFFSDHKPTIEDRFAALVEHIEYFEKLDHLPFYNIKKHLAWYLKAFEGAKELRMKLMQSHSSEEARSIIKLFRANDA